MFTKVIVIIISWCIKAKSLCCTLNLYGAVCQLHLNKLQGNKQVKKKKDDQNCTLALYVGFLALRHLVAPPETARVHFLAPWPWPQLVGILERKAEYLEL